MVIGLSIKGSGSISEKIKKIGRIERKQFLVLSQIIIPDLIMELKSAQISFLKKKIRSWLIHILVEVLKHQLSILFSFSKPEIWPEMTASEEMYSRQVLLGWRSWSTTVDLSEILRPKAINVRDGNLSFLAFSSVDPAP